MTVTVPAPGRPAPDAAGAGRPRRRCAAERADGAPCRGFVVAGSLFCQWHDPDRRADREERAARTRAERARERRAWAASGWLGDPLGPAGLETPAQRRAFAASVVRATRDGRLEPDAARATLEGLRLLDALTRRRRRKGGRPWPCP
jgi:hypothetical protein